MIDRTNQSEQSPARTTRRRFLGQVAVGATAFSIVPRHVLGGSGQTPPSERLNIAGVGMGGQGTGLIQQFADHNIVALCDVDDNQAARAYERFPQAKRYRDFRLMLEQQKVIDAVVVATTDNLHASVSMMAMRMGKHVYCEKPLTHTIYEARMLAEAAREHKVATQMGNAGQASEGTRRTAEYLADGAIGPVREVHIWTDRPLGWWPQGIDRPQGSPPVPSTLDWDLWLGPAPERPYHPAYLPFVWRGWRDFGTGALGDMGCHAFDPVFRAIELGHPTSVVASSTELNTETYPLASMVHYEFPPRGDWPAVKLTWYDGGLKPDWPAGLGDGGRLGSNGTMFIGDNGVLLGGRQGVPTLLPEARNNEYEPPEKSLPRSIGHHAEWIAACKGGPPAGANFEFASLVTQVVLLGNIALRIDQRSASSGRGGARRPGPMPKLTWDGANMKVTNLPEANDYLHREYRKGWTL
jgi:predicted dehydrogenase